MKCTLLHPCELARCLVCFRSLQWRRNECDGDLNHQRLDCLLNRLFRRRSKKIWFRITGLCEGNSPVTGDFPTKGPVTRKMFLFDDVIMWGTINTFAGIFHTQLMSLRLNLVNCLAKIWLYHQTSSIRRIISKNLNVSCRVLQLFFAQSIEARCKVGNEDVVGVAPTLLGSKSYFNYPVDRFTISLTTRNVHATYELVVQSCEVFSSDCKF